MPTLIIVESPYKTRAVWRYANEVIPGKVIVRSCLGHLRDLPTGELGVDSDRGFMPQYCVPKSRTRTVFILRPVVRAANRIILATDPDREGEAVAWHFTQVFKAELENKTVERVAFNALTREAVQTALRHPKALDELLIRAAMTRRVMDRMIGFRVSPRLWAVVSGRDHAAGRVQTVALRLLIEHFQMQIKASPIYTVDVEI
jgi:DNA topoisomerase I